MGRSVSVYLKKGLESKLKQLAAADHKPLSTYLRELLEEALNSKKQTVLQEDIIPQVTKAIKDRENRFASLLARTALDGNATRNFVVNAMVEMGLPRHKVVLLNEDAYKTAVTTLKTKHEDLKEIVAALTDIDDAREASKVIARIQGEARRLTSERDEP